MSGTRTSPTRNRLRLGGVALTCALQAILVLPVPEAVAQDCQFEGNYIGQRPRNRNGLGWNENTQGIAHDEANWFVSTADSVLTTGRLFSEAVIYRLPGSQDLRTNVCCEGDAFCPDPFTGRVAVTCAKLDDNVIGRLDYDHYGDMDVYQGHLCVPIEYPDKKDPAVLARFDTATLELEDFGFLPTATGAICTVDASGLVYVAREADASEISRYTVDWDDVGTHTLFLPQEVGVVHLLDEQGMPVWLERIQGADFGDDGLLYVLNGKSATPCDDRCGIHVFELREPGSDAPCGPEGDCDAIRIAKSQNNDHDAFRYQYNNDTGWPPGRQEPEGLTWWDLSAPGVPEMPGIQDSQLHALLLENDLREDEIWLKHYHVETRCAEASGIAVTPTVIEFGDVDVGESAERTLRIANTGDAVLGIDEIDLVDDEPSPFSLLDLPPLPADVEPGAAIVASVGFEPSAGGRQTAQIEVTSSAPGMPLVVVTLGGDGLSVHEQLLELIENFEEGAAEGLLVGLGGGDSAEHRLAALGDMLVEADSLLEDGFVSEACGQLHAALMHADGEAPPDDFVGGAASGDMAGDIRELRMHLSCRLPGSGCGLGFELVLVLPPLVWLRSKRRSRHR